MSSGALLPLLTDVEIDAIDQFGRVPVVIVEVVQDFCTNAYGVNNGTTSFCQASGQIGSECFNTYKTCQDLTNYRRGQKMIRFCKPMQDLPVDWQAIPSVKTATTTPPRINAGGQSVSSGALGIRGTVTVTLQDHPGSDLALDPYVNNRVYDPLTKGTFWSKWIARNTYYQHRPLRLRFGYLGQDIDDMALRQYVLETVDGPDHNGIVKLYGRDILALTDDNEVTCPKRSRGVLQSNITNVATSFTVVGLLSDYYAAPGFIRIRDEVMAYGAVSEAAGIITFSSVTRGQKGTVAEAHTANDSVQAVYSITNKSPGDLLLELLTVYAGIGAQFIDAAGIQQEAATWLIGYEATTDITDPVGIARLLSELCEQLQIMLWVDERSNHIKMMALRPPLEVPRTVDEITHITQKSSSFKEDTEQRLSQVWVWFNQINPVLKLEEEANFHEVRVRIDVDSEGPNQYNNPKIKRIFSRWFKTGAQINDMEQRILSRFRDNPTIGSISLDAKDRDIWTGQLIQIQSRLRTDYYGNEVSRLFQVIGAQEIEPGHRIKLDVQSYDVGLARGVGRYTASDAPIYINATIQERLAGGWFASTAGLMPDNTDGYSYQ